MHTLVSLSGAGAARTANRAALVFMRGLTRETRGGGARGGGRARVWKAKSQSTLYFQVLLPSWAVRSLWTKKSKPFFLLWNALSVIVLLSHYTAQAHPIVCVKKVLFFAKENCKIGEGFLQLFALCCNDTIPGN